MGIWDIVRSASDAIVSSTIAQQERVEREVNRKIRATERNMTKSMVMLNQRKKLPRQKEN